MRILRPWRPAPTWPASPLAVLAIRLWGYSAVLYGMAVVIGGPCRWSATIYAAVNVVPGSPYSWGVAIAVAGAAIVLGSHLRRRRLRNLGLYGFALWLAMFAVCFAINAIRDPQSPFTGVVLLAAIAGHALILARTREESP